jgi:hypothetical protein
MREPADHTGGLPSGRANVSAICELTADVNQLAPYRTERNSVSGFWFRHQSLIVAERQRPPREVQSIH